MDGVSEMLLYNESTNITLTTNKYSEILDFGIHFQGNVIFKENVVFISEAEMSKPIWITKKSIIMFAFALVTPLVTPLVHFEDIYCYHSNQITTGIT